MLCLVLQFLLVVFQYTLILIGAVHSLQQQELDRMRFSGKTNFPSHLPLDYTRFLKVVSVNLEVIMLGKVET